MTEYIVWYVRNKQPSPATGSATGGPWGEMPVDLNPLFERRFYIKLARVDKIRRKHMSYGCIVRSLRFKKTLVSIAEKSQF